MGNFVTTIPGPRTTINNLPNDMLHEIFERVLADKSTAGPWPLVRAFQPPDGAHLALRCVCRRWRDIADCARLSTSTFRVDTSRLDDAGTVRLRHPAAIKSLLLECSTDGHSNGVARAAALINGSADMQRALLWLTLRTCCLPALLPAVTPIASCTALTELRLYWSAHKQERMIRSKTLAPLSALRMLDTLTYGRWPEDTALPRSALLAPLPALPDAPRLTHLSLRMTGNFVPVGSDAALGRLRRLHRWHKAPVQELVDAEDPFLLRAAFDAGTWLENMMFECDATSLADAPTANEFAERARQLLPALVRVVIVAFGLPDDPTRFRWPDEDVRPPDRVHAGPVLACRRHVFPALLKLHARRN